LAINQEERLEGKILGPHPARTTPEQRDRAWGFLGLMSPIPESAASQIAVTTTLSVKVWPQHGHAGSIGIISS